MWVRLAYQLLMYLSQAALALLALFLSGESKLAKMLRGRKQSLERLKQIPKKNKKRVWAHAASLGEFQMLLPLLQKIEIELNSDIHVSFFSPSGYEHA